MVALPHARSVSSSYGVKGDVTLGPGGFRAAHDRPAVPFTGENLADVGSEFDGAPDLVPLGDRASRARLVRVPCVCGYSERRVACTGRRPTRSRRTPSEPAWRATHVP